MAFTIDSKEGESVTVAKQNKAAEYRIDLGWDPAKEGANVDVDVSCVVRKPSGETLDCCYYRKLTLAVGNDKPYIIHSADDTTGSNSDDGPDETVEIDLHRVPAEVSIVDIFMNIYDGQRRGQFWGSLSRVFCDVVDKSTGNKIHVTPDVKDFTAASEVSMLVVRFSRDAKGGWSMLEPSEKYNSDWTDLKTFVGLTLPADAVK